MKSFLPFVFAAGCSAALPDYVLTYAPVVWLDVNETYFPSDLTAQLDNSYPAVNYTRISNYSAPLTLDNLDQLNNLGNTSVYLTSNEGIEADPSWFGGVKPDSNGKTNDATSCAIVTFDHGNGTVDAFYFYFYAYNKGDKVVGIWFGDHVGDWEHNMIRFDNGEPQALWYSQHAGGEAFTYNATLKIKGRPVAYSGRGTHANYAIPGKHDHAIPGHNLPDGFVVDYTSNGTLWDPTGNYYAYSYDNSTTKFTPYDSSYPVNWLYYNGQWGDIQVANQTGIFGEYTYTSGPNGPKFKGLVRDNVCPNGDDCDVKDYLIW
ncbi:Putative vacuolar protein sorting-associated protein TDA6 [Talaromyces islandicus]|uniref:Putative vacuolar protein sorting-associated protein TDA6 n=1 Tax=Talaromyces islandicus TaxID=28573 RepID=A0A0U1LKA8_TALIS|nr:Putative vacuolar protein sorting-associated protein TDA6 [Talaromyces islandicus]